MEASTQVWVFYFYDRETSLIYSGTLAEGVYASTDAGEHLRPMNEGLTNGYVQALKLNAMGSVLYAGTAAGVFRYDLP